MVAILMHRLVSPPRAPVLAGVLALTLLAPLACQEVQDEESRKPVSLLRPEASPTSSPSPTLIPLDLPPAAERYKWMQVPPNMQFGFPGYVFQIPVGWMTAGLRSNPADFIFPGIPQTPGPSLHTMVVPVSAGFEHPILFNLPMSGTTCGSGVPQGQMPGSGPDAPDVAPAGQFSGDVYTWDVYIFTCGTRVTAVEAAEGKTSIPFDVRGAEVVAAEFIFGVTAFEPPGSAAAQRAFEQALRSFRQQ